MRRLLLTLSGHPLLYCTCPLLWGKADSTFCGNSLSRSLLDLKRTCLFALHMSAFDPKRTKTASLSPVYAAVMVFRAISPVASPAQNVPPMKTAVAIAPEEDFYSVSNLPASRTQKQLALTVVLITSGVAFVVSGPLSGVRLRPGKPSPKQSLKSPVTDRIRIEHWRIVCTE